VYNKEQKTEVFFLTRSCGILLPVSSLPGRWGIGDLGPGARSFVDFLSRSGQKTWQILPLSETDGALGNSPYSSPSAFAGNHLFISPDDLFKCGLLTAADTAELPPFPGEKVDYPAVRAVKEKLLARAFERFAPSKEYETFLQQNEHWVFDYALFSALKQRFGGLSWNQWPDELKLRDGNALRTAATELRESVDFLLFKQYLFFSSMERLRRECDEKGVELLGDLPIYVNFDSADVWAHPNLFHLDENLLPVEVAGVPPDYFSETGQLWGNPLYNWEALREDDFSWWIKRLQHSLSMFHLVRIDHFRGLLAYWAVPFGDRTAEKGVWRDVPSEAFFASLRKNIPSASFLAENLGVITPDVTDAMERMSFPGMAVVLFAFGGGMKDNPHIPHNYSATLAAYSGTHDNNTALGWYRDDASEEERNTLGRYLGRMPDEKEVPDIIVRMVLSSVAQRAIIPLQDYLGLGSEARMNTPATPSGNWEWRADELCFTEELSIRIKQLSEIYGRN